MQNNNRRKKNTKGFYILLAACALVIGVSAYVFVSDAAREQKEADLTGAAVSAQSEQLTQQLPASQTMVQEEELRQTQTETAETVMPVSGQVLRDYAMEELTYNATTKDWRTHDGVDLTAQSGETVKAARKGTVLAVYEDPLYGMTVELSHADGYTTCYSGLTEEIAVQVGQEVTAGQSLGTVGTVLVETAMESHLHFSVCQNGTSVDPAAFLYH